LNKIYFLLFWYGFGELFSSDIYFSLPGIVLQISNRIDDLIFLYISFEVFVNLVLNKKINRLLMTFIFLFGYIIFLTSVINLVSPITVSMFILRYCKILITIIYIDIQLKHENINFFKVKKYLRYFVGLQFILNLLWFLDINIIPNRLSNDFDDWAVGTMGDCFYVGLISSIALADYFYDSFFVRNNIKIQFKNFIGFSLCLVQLIWVDTKHLFFLVPLILIILLITLPILSKKLKFIFMIFFLFAITYSLNSNFVKYFINNYETAQTVIQKSPKVQTYYHSFISIPNEVPYKIFGAGPGQAGSFIGKENKAFLNEKYFMRYDIPELRLGNSVLTLPYNGVTTIQSELGYVGFFSVFMIIISILYNLFLRLKHHIISNKKSMTSNLLFVGLFSLILFVFENIISDYLHTSFFPVFVAFFVSSIMFLLKK